MSDGDKSNFSLGFVVGALAGVAGFFLTRTKEGKVLRKKASKEWGKVRKKLEDEGVISGDGQDFSDIILNIRTKVFEILNEEPPKKKKKTAGKAKRGRPKSSAGSKKASSPVKKRKKMFKGT